MESGNFGMRNSMKYTVSEQHLRTIFIDALRTMIRESNRKVIPPLLTMLDKSKKVHTISYDSERACLMLDIDGVEKRFNPKAVTGVIEYIKQFNPDSFERFIDEFYENIEI